MPSVDSPADTARPGRALKVSVSAVEREFVAKKSTVKALGPLDLDVATGDFCCVVGPSGCGKSTLLRIVAGLVNPSKGEVVIYRGDASAVPVAMVFQDYSIYPWKTVEQNVALGLVLSGVPKDEVKRRVARWLGKLGLSQFASAFPATLSGGMRQRVSIARALVVEPELLLMDEPFAALDAQLRLVLQEELLALWEQDRKTVLFVTHSLEEAILLGDRVIVMSARPGRILADIRVPFERPRVPELRGDAAFAALHEEIWELLRGELETGQTKEA